MSLRPIHHRQILFRCCVLAGAFLSVLLLFETWETYRYVQRDLVREEAQRESGRHVRSIIRAARLMHAEQSSWLGPLLQEMARDYPHQIAWMRVIAEDGRTIAASGPGDEGPKYSADELGKALERRQTREWKAASGPVLIELSPLQQQWADNPRGSGSGQPQELIEVALWVKGISVNFGPLRQDLITGIAAALALLGTVIVIGLRFGEYIRAKQIEKELLIARQVQTDLFPADDCGISRSQFAARCVPAWEVGGDIYDVFTTDAGETAFVLGDVSGKGLPAALLMGLVQGAVRASCAGCAIQCSQTAEHLNGLLCAKTARERFVTMFWCTFNAETGILRYVNAGHCRPLLIRDSGEVLRLEVGGPVLGVLPDARYQYAEIMIEPGDLLVIFSDGIVEATDAHEEEYGEERLLSVIQRNRTSAPAEICNSVLESVKGFLGSEPAQDDQTLMIARLQPAQADITPSAEAGELMRAPAAA